MKTLINLFCYYVKLFIPMNISVIDLNLMKSFYLQKMNFKVAFIWKILQLLIIDMQKMHLKNFKLKHLGDCYDLYVQSDTLLLADVFENFRKMFIRVYELYPSHFLSASELAWQACLKKQK